MDLFKAITGKNPADFEPAARKLVETPDVELFKRLVKQDDFLFDFVKNNVAKRIQQVCNKDNYRNILEFLNYYSPSYDVVFAEVLHHFGEDDIDNEMKQLYLEGSKEQKAYAAKYLNYFSYDQIKELLPVIRDNSKSDYEPLAINSIELLASNKDTESKLEALERLKSEDEFEQYNAVKFLVTYGAADVLPQIFGVMKRSSLSENIAAEIPYLINLEKLLESNFEAAVLILCHIVNAVPEIVPLSAVIDYSLYEIFENLYYESLTSSSALLLKMAKEKFSAIAENEEYMFDCDKNTKDEIANLNKFFSLVNTNKLNSLLYDELYDESDFVEFAVDYVDDVEELETLLDSSNQTLLLKVLSRLKDKNELKAEYKEKALNNVTIESIRQVIEVL